MWNEIAKGLWSFDKKSECLDRSKFMCIPLNEFSDKERKIINAFYCHGGRDFKRTFEFLCSIPELHGEYNLNEIKNFYNSISGRKRNYDRQESDWRN